MLYYQFVICNLLTDWNKVFKKRVKSYNGENSWEYDFINPSEKLPDGLLLEILGNRKNIIFTEGETGSLDTSIYQSINPEFHIIPRGSGHKVIEATKALRSNKELHHLNIFGIIDSDYKEDDEKSALFSLGIHTISVAEIENLFCIEPILRIIAIHQELDQNMKVKEANFIIDALKSEFENQVSSKAEKIIEYRLGAFSKKAQSKIGLKDGLKETLGRIDIDKIYSEVEKSFNEAIDEKNLNKLLLIYNRKSLIDRISSIFGLAHGEYKRLLVRLLKGSKKKELISALKIYLPNIQ